MQPANSWTFLVDENMSVTLALTLQTAGYQAAHVYDVGLQGHLDTAVFAYAQAHQHTMITGDLDFANIREYGPPHFGIIVLQIPNETPQAERIQEVLNALSTLSGQSLINTLVIVEKGRIRIHR